MQFTWQGGVPVPSARQPPAQQPWQQQSWQQQSWQQDPWQKEDRGPPHVLNLELTQVHLEPIEALDLQESQLTTQGVPPEAPAIVHDKGMTVFSSVRACPRAWNLCLRPTRSCRS